MKPTALAVRAAALTFAAAPAFAECAGHSKSQTVQAPSSTQTAADPAPQTPSQPKG